eukprot:CAMPEP_0205801680 /NCGR_PEP_ID=MMETSP0205-20121125/3740_1 /ASSEMBLY_ACC=CAM_ASM_000278 /TAXON_ID=36767 /ORGANISM="Euplotes focardii, Strain TN1" /LENGTH=157 /DNA_ID=CAMNT_0053066813 /DNA_START=1153 /DNA_END=1626 /DNA_ORIENTATION=+
MNIISASVDSTGATFSSYSFESTALLEIISVDLPIMTRKDQTVEQIEDYVRNESELYFDPIYVEVTFLHVEIVEKTIGNYNFPKVCLIDSSQTVEYKIEAANSESSAPTWVKLDSTNTMLEYTVPEINNVGQDKFNIKAVLSGGSSTSYEIKFDIEN